MLIEKKKKYAAGDILSFKMVSGDEIVGKLVEQSDNNYTLNKPCIVVTSPDGIGLIQAMFGLDPDLEDLTVRDQHIVMLCKTHIKMQEHYISVTTAE